MRGKRTRLATGIYEDATGVSIIVSVRGKPREFRQNEHRKSYTGWTLHDLRIERKRLDAREHLKVDPDAAWDASLRADVQAYLHTLSGRTKEDAKNLLKHWTHVFGDRRRAELTALDFRQVAAQWTVKPSTFNHRRQALISLYKALDGPHAANPAREIPKQKEMVGAAKALSYDVIEAVLKAMPETQSRARLKVMAYTGLPQMQIERLTPTDWQRDRLRVTPRRKGAGAAGRWIPLAPEAQAALKEFARLKCWGPFSRSSLCKAWKAYGPAGTNPYSLRHSWITELYRRSNGDVLAVKQLALHSMLAQTERYAAAALEERMQFVVGATNRAGNHSTSLALPPPARKAAKTISRGGHAKNSAKIRRK